MTESELIKRVAELEAKNLELSEENDRLREMLGLPLQKTSPKEAVRIQSIQEHTNRETAPQSTINKYSTPDEKIELFLSLFRGRTDVYAKRCYSKKYGSSYYIPACKNEWTKGLCDKARVKCKDCPNRDLLSLGKEIINNHLRNKNEHGAGVIGIYPLLQDETCLFIAVDFDEEKWEEDITAFRFVCNTYNIPVAIERSRSGNGAHAWIFFEEPIPAISARRLGNALLTNAMSVRHEIRFTSYDRMFPNQDFMPKGGFGNLIALPLQGGARKNGNSEFVDENFHSYPDQWDYLAAIRKMNSDEIKRALAILCEGNGLGELGSLENNNEEASLPWESNKVNNNLEKNDFPDNLTIFEANPLPEQEKKRGRKKVRTIIGQIGSGKNTASGIIDIALVQSLVHENEVDDVVKEYGMVIVDECHHASSLNYEKVLGATSARYVYGLTATPQRQDGQHPVTFMQCGPIRYSVSAKGQADKRNFEHYITPCFTGFRRPLTQNESDWHITKIFAALAENELRNQQIATDVKESLLNGRTPIILTQRKEHVMRLTDLLKDQVDAHIIALVGADSAKVKNKMVESLTLIPHDEKLVLIATGKYIGEGFDYPRLDTLFLASPIAWKGTLAQYAGRLHREYPGKQDVIVYDYVDIHIPVLERMYHKRLTGYAQIGYKALSSKNEPDRISMIYDCNTFIPAIRDDFGEARKEILIASPHILKKQISTVFEWLKEPLFAGVLITIITRPVESSKDPEQTRKCIELLHARFKVIQESDIYQKYIIIDNRLVWYGSISLFDTGDSDDTIMRLESRELVEELAAERIKNHEE